MQVTKGYNEVVKQVEALGSRSGKTSKLVYIQILIVGQLLITRGIYVNLCLSSGDHQGEWMLGELQPNPVKWIRQNSRIDCSTSSCFDDLAEINIAR